MALERVIRYAAGMSAQIDPFHAISISGLAHRLKAEGRQVIHMEFGQPSTGAPKAAVAAAHAVLDTDAMGYWESAPLKARICRHYAETYGVTVEPAQIIQLRAFLTEPDPPPSPSGPLPIGPAPPAPALGRPPNRAERRRERRRSSG